MREEELVFDSHDATSRIHVWLWEPDDLRAAGPRGIVQIIHGASEYAARYRDFAEFLTAAGLIVCADDHSGHGLSASTEEELGHLSVSGGFEALLADEHHLREIISERYHAFCEGGPDGQASGGQAFGGQAFGRELPYCMLGHSMGSFILRSYCARQGEGLAAVVLSGTGHQPSGLSFVGNKLARMIASIKGAHYRSPLLHRLGMGALSQGIRNPRTPFDWLNTDAAAVDAYRADPFCGMVFTAGGYSTLTELTADIVKAKPAAKVPAGLPVLFVAGDEDPVGEKGRSVARAADLYIKAGVKKVDTRMYRGMRHEILNEPEHEKVYRDILDWLEPMLRSG